MQQARIPKLPALLLFLVNAYVCRELFTTEWLDQMGSIEGAYIAIARYAAANFPDLTWFPPWYGGVPYQNTYPPLLHAIVALVSWAGGISPALAYHAVIAFFFCAGPAAVYWLAWRLSQSAPAAFLAGVFYTAISPSAFLMEAIRRDMGGLWGSRRLQVLVGWGEGPHVTAITLLAVALACLHVALTRRRARDYVLAVLAIAAVPLTNWLAAFALALGVACLAAAMLPFERGWKQLLLPLPAMGAAAYAIAGPWIPPSTVRVIQFNARTIEGDFSGVYADLPWRLAAALGVAALLKLILHRLRAPALAQFAALFAWFTGAITLASAWFDVPVLPQPLRYHIPMEMGVCVLAASLLLLAPRRRWAAAALVTLALVPAVKDTRRIARDFLIKPADITKTTVYKTAKWMDENLGGVRVMAPGATSFWLNAFTDTPQLGGGFEQGATNWMNRMSPYVLYTDDGAGERKAEISIAWLKALGVHAIAVGGPGSGEYYKPFRNPGKFAGVLAELWRDGDDAIYRVPHRTTSLARVIRPEGRVERAPVNGVDIEPMLAYLGNLEDASLPEARWEWLSRHSGRITGELRPEHLISLQMSYHPGWSATRGGRGIAIRQDGLGQMLLQPECGGACTIEVSYDGGVELRFLRGLQILALVAGVVFLLKFR
ncbi:MAG: hypothetical protein K2X35_17840 [Bryobacteraceae bacterium]|nr:hypothetical protein [Bryobacteraceae bacterium]